MYDFEQLMAQAYSDTLFSSSMKELYKLLATHEDGRLGLGKTQFLKLLEVMDERKDLVIPKL